MVRYVGKTNQPKKRYRGHVEDRFNKRSHKRSWINSLKTQGQLPIMEIIDEVPIDDWKFWEKFYVALFKTWGFKLVNHTSGGDGCTFGNSTSFKKGQTPWMKGRTVSEETRAKIKAKRRAYIFTDAHKHNISKVKKGKQPPYMRYGISDDQLHRMSKTQFKLGSIPWNKGMQVQLKTPRLVLEFDLSFNLIREWKSAKDASIYHEVHEDTVASCCRGKVKKVKRQHIFKYKP